MSSDLYTFVSYYVKEKKLRQSPPFAIVGRDTGKRLLERAERVVIVSDKGYLYSNMRAYFFTLNGMSFYFETSEYLGLPEVQAIEIDQIEIPRT